MVDLQVGLVGVQVTGITAQRVSDGASGSDRRVNISGFLRAASLTETNVIRTGLLNHVGDLVPIVYATDPTIDGFYILDDADVDVDRRDGALQGAGYFGFSIDATRIGSYAQTELQSLLSLVSADEDHSTTESYWWAPAIGAQAVDAGGGTPVLVDRAGDDGTISVATDLPDVNPSWSIPPADYYAGAVTITAGGYRRTGLDMPMDPTDWVLGNSFMEIRPSVFQGTSDGELEVRFHNGASWGSWTAFQIEWASTNKVPSWNYVSIASYRDGAIGTIRLVRDAAESPFATTTKHELDITLRRGGRLVSCVYKFSGATAYQHAVAQSAGDASTRPASASYIRGDVLIDARDRWVLGTPRAFTKIGSQLKLDVVSKSMPFFIAAAVDDAANGTGNGPADLAEQYVGQVAESVRAVRR